MQCWSCRFFYLRAAFLQMAVKGVVAGGATTIQCFTVQGKLDNSGVMGLL